MAKTHSKSTFLLIIFITVFIDMLGITIIIPVIPAIFFEDSTFFVNEISRETKSMIFGALLLCYPLMQFFGAPMLGTLSDKYGRKPVLTIALVGTLIGYILFAISIVIQNLPLMFFSRMLPGFTGGNISIIYSAISDVSNAEERTRNFGLVGMSFGLGFVLGPTIGGILADNTVVSWFTHATPFWVTAGLTVFNILLVKFLFKETLKQKRFEKVNLFKGIQNIVLSFKIKELKSILLILFFISVGFTFFTQFFSVFVYEKFSWSEKDVGFLFMWVGIWLAFTQGVIVRYLSYRVKPKKVLMFSIPITFVGILLLLVPDQGWVFYAINPIIAIGHGLTMPNLTSLVSDQAGPDRQGEILGINQSMRSLGQIVPPLIAGYLNGLNMNYPMTAAGIVMVIAYLIYLYFYSNRSTLKVKVA